MRHRHRGRRAPPQAQQRHLPFWPGVCEGICTTRAAAAKPCPCLARHAQQTFICVVHWARVARPRSVRDWRARLACTEAAAPAHSGGGPGPTRAQWRRPWPHACTVAAALAPRVHRGGGPGPQWRWPWPHACTVAAALAPHVRSGGGPDPARAQWRRPWPCACTVAAAPAPRVHSGGGPGPARALSLFGRLRTSHIT